MMNAGCTVSPRTLTKLQLGWTDLLCADVRNANNSLQFLYEISDNKAQDLAAKLTKLEKSYAKDRAFWADAEEKHKQHLHTIHRTNAVVHGKYTDSQKALKASDELRTGLEEELRIERDQHKDQLAAQEKRHQADLVFHRAREEEAVRDKDELAETLRQSKHDLAASQTHGNELGQRVESLTVTVAQHEADKVDLDQRRVAA